jgi:hypothetical protein
MTTLTTISADMKKTFKKALDKKRQVSVRNDLAFSDVPFQY